MSQNPYKYSGPLAPDADKLVCVLRTEALNRVIEGIIRDDYWAIIGPRQIGKTTFLRQIKHTFPRAHYIYFNFQVPPSNAEKLYRLLMKQFLKEIDSEKPEPISNGWKSYRPELRFINFLERFKPKDDKKRIIILFDEIDKIPSLIDFLHVWRKIYTERYHKNVLGRYTVIITGSVDLIALTIGPNSPFNVAEIFYIQDFSDEESEKLIDEPMKQLNIKIEPEAKEYLISQVSGHPQLLQQMCHILVDKAIGQKRSITKKNIDNAINLLFKTSTTLDTLREDLKVNDKFANLIREILDGKKKLYYPLKEFSTSGVGAIVDDENFCSIRNEIFKKFLKHIPEISTDSLEEPEKKPIVFISYSRKDKEWKDKLSTHLGVLEHQRIILTWDDQKIPAGEDWFGEIKEKMGTANIAVFLISANSLTSDFILREEIPVLLKQKKEEGMAIFPIIVRDCAWEEVKWLRKMQIMPGNAEPLERYPEWKQNQIFKEIVRKIAKISKAT